MTTIACDDSFPTYEQTCITLSVFSWSLNANNSLSLSLSLSLSPPPSLSLSPSLYSTLFLLSMRYSMQARSTHASPSAHPAVSRTAGGVYSATRLLFLLLTLSPVPFPGTRSLLVFEIIDEVHKEVRSYETPISSNSLVRC